LVQTNNFKLITEKILGVTSKDKSMHHILEIQLKHTNKISSKFHKIILQKQTNITPYSIIVTPSERRRRTIEMYFHAGLHDQLQTLTSEKQQRKK
ncbi:hypothetical protein ACJX0J_031360, partial [Zea mays]